MEEPTPAWPAILTPSAILICPTIPTCAAIIQFFPTFVEPATPDNPAITVFSPISTLCAICTKLSNLTPLRSMVEPNVALSIEQFDPISILSSMITFILRSKTKAITANYRVRVNSNLVSNFAFMIYFYSRK